MSESKTSEKMLKAADRARQALELRTQGKGFQDIADTLGFKSVSGAYDAVMGALKRTLQEPAEEVRKIEVERLDRLMSGIWDKAADGDVQAMDRLLKIMARRAALQGLDKQTPGGVTVPIKVYLGVNKDRM